MSVASFGLFAQDHYSGAGKTRHADSSGLKESFTRAHWGAHTRTFAMGTLNQGELKDDYAVGTGAGISMETRPFKGFQAGMSGFFIYNLYASEIHIADKLTGQPNRYEVGLFDIEDHDNGNDLDRLEELYLKYKQKKIGITLGKFIPNNPFINPQDGRMRPTVAEGVWMDVKPVSKLELSAGWIWSVSPRSTVRWYSVANSMGVYPVGVDTEGKKSAYKGNIQGNSGIGILNLQYKPTEKLNVIVWNGFIENVLNTGVLEIKHEQKRKGFTYFQGLILMHQDAINNGGNVNQNLSYVLKGSKSNALSAQAGIKSRQFNYSLNYTRITADGRYLMPREWGKEVFYTFMPRERVEGYGNVHALMGKAQRQFNPRFNASLSYGFVKLPDVLDYRLNKYGMPSYHQINVQAAYAFTGFLDGMELRFLAAYKQNAGETYGNLKYMYNKVNMLNLNLILDFKI